MPPAIRTRDRSSPYADGNGESSRAANAQATGRVRATRSRSGSALFSEDDNDLIVATRVTRSQAKTPVVARMDQIIEDELIHDEDDEDDEADDIAVQEISNQRRRMEIRRSLVAGYGDDEGRLHVRSKVFSQPLTLEERAVRLRRDASVVLQALLEQDGEDSQTPLGMLMAAKTGNLRSARQSIYYNESFDHFLDREALLSVQDYNPFDHSQTLNSAVRLANIAAFVQIIDSPEEAADKLEKHGDNKTVPYALREAWLKFLPLCVKKPWTGITEIQFLVDLATQRVFVELEESGKPLMANGLLNPSFEEALSEKAFADLPGWLEEDDALGERDDALKFWRERTRIQREKLQRCKTLQAAMEALSYQDFKQDMLVYIGNALETLDVEEDPGQPTVLRDLPSGRINEEDGNREDEQDAMTIDNEVTQLDEEAISGDEAPDINLSQAEFDGLRQKYSRQDDSANEQVRDVERDEGGEDNDDDDDDDEALAESQWQVKKARGLMQPGQAMSGGKAVGRADQRRLVLESAGPVEWDSQIAEPSQQGKPPRKRRVGRLAARSQPAVAPEPDAAVQEDTLEAAHLENNFEGAHDGLEAGNALLAESVASEERQGGRIHPQRRHHRAGHYSHQPDVDPPRRAVREPRTAPENDEQEINVQRPVGKAQIFAMDPADDYLYDERRRLLHDKNGRALRLHKGYFSKTNTTREQDNRMAYSESYRDGAHPYRALLRTRWSREDGLFLYREVQKVPSGLMGQPTAYVYNRFHHEPCFRGRNSNQVRDKMKDMVKQRYKTGRLVLGSARHYLPPTDPRHVEYQEERVIAQEHLVARRKANEEDAASDHNEDEQDYVSEEFEADVESEAEQESGLEEGEEDDAGGEVVEDEIEGEVEDEAAINGNARGSGPGKERSEVGSGAAPAPTDRPAGAASNERAAEFEPENANAEEQFEEEEEQEAET